MGLGENIKHMRIKRGYSQDYLAEQLGYKSYTTIQKWESGVSEPPIKVLRELATILNVDINDLANKDLTQPSDTSSSSYYLDEEAEAAAQFLFENPEYKVLFDASRKVKPEDINFVKEMIERLTNK